jgi:FAD binding domain/Berberine and berberine like
MTDSVTAPGSAPLQRSAIRQLAEIADGPVLIPGDEGYAEEVATFNLTMQQQPAVVVGATGAADVSAAIRFAAERNMPVGVLATGHGITLPADGAVLITTRRMDGVSVEPRTRTAMVEAGVRSQQLTEAAAHYGLAAITGSSPLVSVVGLVSGGGLSPFLGRREGYAADHVRALELVTADGTVRRASRDQDSDLFWAVRGGKDNFGIITGMELELFPVPGLLGGGLFFPGDQAEEVLRTFGAWVKTVPEDMTGSVALLRLPPLEIIPEFLRGQFVVHVRIAYLGPADEGEQLIEPFRKIGPRIADTVTVMPYSAVGSIYGEPEQPIPFFDSSARLRELPDPAIDVILKYAGPGTGCPITVVEVRHLGGALGRPPRVPSAVTGRDAQFQVFCVGVGGPPAAASLYAAEDELLGQLSPWQTSQGTLNYLSARDARAGRAPATFEPATLERLTRIKRAYDPANMFRLNHNIPPA